jgi:hypothetical protein
MSAPRRLAILWIGAWLLLVLPFPAALHGAGAALLALLVGLGISLGARTGWFAVVPRSALDERLRLARDEAYRAAFRCAGLGCLVAWVSATFASNHSWGVLVIPAGLGGRRTAAMVALFVLLPTVVVALRQPADEEDRLRAQGRRPALGPTLAGVGSVAGMLVLASAAPASSAGLSRIPADGYSSSSANCGQFAGEREVGFGFGASMRWRAMVCWNGSRAFLLKPPVEGAEQLRTVCSLQPGADDFALITDQGCSEATDAQGTLHIRVHAHYELPGGLLGRDLESRLDVSRDGVYHLGS